MASELKECNIGGGVATFKSSQDGGLPRLFLHQHQKRSGNPAGGARGRMEVKRRRSFKIFKQLSASGVWFSRLQTLGAGGTVATLIRGCS